MTSTSNPISRNNAIQGVLTYLREGLANPRSARSGIVSSKEVLIWLTINLSQQSPSLNFAECSRSISIIFRAKISLIYGFREAFPGIPKIACFGTAFHKDIPRIAQMLPIPRHYLNAGLPRFGFHRLTYTYLMEQLAVVAGAEVANGRDIFAHLGSGASMAAVHNGKSIDTTMAALSAAGLAMPS